MSTKCPECGKKYTKERRPIYVQYLSGEYESCHDCIQHAKAKGYIRYNPMDFLVGHRMYHRGLVSIGVLDHIKAVFDERTKVRCAS